MSSLKGWTYVTLPSSNNLFLLTTRIPSARQLNYICKSNDIIPNGKGKCDILMKNTGFTIKKQHFLLSFRKKNYLCQ